MVVLAKLPIRMTVEECYAWDPGEGYTYELVDGEPRAMAPAGTIPGLLQIELCDHCLFGHHRSRDPLHLYLVGIFHRLCHVVGRLHPVPSVGTAAERLG